MTKRYFHIDDGEATEVPAAVGEALFGLVDERDETFLVRSPLSAAEVAAKLSSGVILPPTFKKETDRGDEG